MEAQELQSYLLKTSTSYDLTSSRLSCLVMILRRSRVREREVATASQIEEVEEHEQQHGLLCSSSRQKYIKSTPLVMEIMSGLSKH